MQRTILQNPICGPIVRASCRTVLFVCGWKAVPPPPSPKKCVVIAAPHTSNWDFVLAVLVCYALNLNTYWLGKKELFPWGAGWFMRWIGGIPVDRANAYNIAKEAILAFRKSDELAMIIPPEATRSKVDDWKRGFYLIAKGAKVPIICGYINYGNKTGGFGPEVMPSGDIAADFKVFRDFYSTITARYPENVGLPVIPESNAPAEKIDA